MRPIGNIVTKSRTVKWAGYVTKFKQMRNVHEIFVGYIDGNRATAKHKRIWDNNINMNLKAIGPGLCDV